MLKRLWMLPLAAACQKEEPPPAGLTEARQATVAGTARARDGTPLEDGDVTIGVSNTRPDPAGLWRFQNQFAGRLVVRSVVDDWTLAAAGADLAIGQTAALRLVSAPRAYETRDLGAALVFGDGDLSIAFPVGAFAANDGTATGPAEVSYLRIAGPDIVVPGGRTWLRDDQYEEPFEAFAIVEISDLVQGDDVLEVSTPADVALVVGADWPYADRADLGIYKFDASEAWWKKVSSAELVDGVVTGTVGSLGWIAVGAQGEPGGCVTGTVLREGEPVLGAEVRWTEADRLGADRVHTDAAGRFCAETRAGASIEVDIFGWGPLGDVLGTGTASATAAGTGCGSVATCADVGVVEMAWVADADGDRFWPGQGDCDDGDVAINPIDSGDLCITE